MTPLPTKMLIIIIMRSTPLPMKNEDLVRVVAVVDVVVVDVVDDPRAFDFGVDEVEPSCDFIININLCNSYNFIDFEKKKEKKKEEKNDKVNTSINKTNNCINDIPIYGNNNNNSDLII